jgi:hypothetical protein
VVSSALVRGCDGVRRYNPVLEQDRKCLKSGAQPPAAFAVIHQGVTRCDDGDGGREVY